MNSKKIKGFTLVELIVVIAILVVLMSISSLVIVGFRRDAQIETSNEKAKIIFTAIQDALIDMEIKQDKSLLDVREFNGSCGDIRSAVMFFRISDKTATGQSNIRKSTGLGDEIHIMTAYTGSVGGYAQDPDGHVATGSIWKHGTTQNVSGYAGYNDYYSDGDGGSSLWNRWNTIIEGHIDPSMTGSYAVMLDLENFEVRSVIYREVLNDGRDPKMGLYFNSFEVASGADSLEPFINSGSIMRVQKVKPKGSSYEIDSLSLMCYVKNMNEQTKMAKAGVVVGCYPYYDEVYA